MGKRAAVLLPVFGLVLSFASMEAFLRLTGRFNPPGGTPHCIRRPAVCALYEHYEPYGYRLKPSQFNEYDYNRRRLSINSDEFGFRSSRSLSDHDGRLRITVLGDSQTFGEGVEESERFTDRLELNHPEWRIDNLGMPGYGTDLMLMSLEEVGIELNPNVVILTVFADDFSRVFPYYTGTGYKIPRFELRSEGLVKVPYPELKIWDQLNVAWAVKKIYWKYSSAERNLNEAILDRFRALAVTHSFVPAIAFLPFDFETGEKNLRAEDDRTWLRDYCARHEVPYADLTEAITRAGWKRVLLENNPHFNPYGHEVIADELGQFLVEQVVS